MSEGGQGRVTRVDKLARVLVERLSTFGWVMNIEDARQGIRERRDQVAATLRVTPSTAMNYLTPSVIEAWAEEIAFARAEEAPGADVLELPRGASVDLPLVAHAVAALSEAIRFWISESDPGATEFRRGKADDAAAVLSMFGQLLLDQEPSEGSAIVLPAAILNRAAACLTSCAQAVEQDVAFLSGPEGPTGEEVAEALYRDATRLRGAAGAV